MNCTTSYYAYILNECSVADRILTDLILITIQVKCTSHHSLISLEIWVSHTNAITISSCYSSTVICGEEIRNICTFDQKSTSLNNHTWSDVFNWSKINCCEIIRVLCGVSVKPRFLKIEVRIWSDNKSLVYCSHFKSRRV